MPFPYSFSNISDSFKAENRINYHFKSQNYKGYFKTLFISTKSVYRASMRNILEKIQNFVSTPIRHYDNKFFANKLKCIEIKRTSTNLDY